MLKELCGKQPSILSKFLTTQAIRFHFLYSANPIRFHSVIPKWGGVQTCLRWSLFTLLTRFKPLGASTAVYESQVCVSSVLAFSFKTSSLRGEGVKLLKPECFGFP